MTYFRNHEKLFIFFGVVFTLFFEFLFLSLIMIPKTLAKNNEVEEIVPIIYQDKLLVKDLLNKFNEKIKLNNLYEINKEFLTERNGTYYVGLFQDVLLFISPLELNNLDSDIVYQTGIIIGNDSQNFDLALKYFKCLVEVNENHVYYLDLLVEEAINNKGEFIDDNNGLLLAYLEDDFEINFILERKYKD